MTPALDLDPPSTTSPSTRRQAEALRQKFLGVAAHVEEAHQAAPAMKRFSLDKAYALAGHLLSQLGDPTPVDDNVLMRISFSARQPDLQEKCITWAAGHPPAVDVPMVAVRQKLAENPKGLTSDEVTNLLALPKQVVQSTLSSMRGRGEIVRAEDGRWTRTGKHPNLAALRQRAREDKDKSIRMLRVLGAGQCLTSNALADLIGRDRTSMSSLMATLAQDRIIQRTPDGKWEVCQWTGGGPTA
jgi:hypothetical protein